MLYFADTNMAQNEKEEYEFEFLDNEEFDIENINVSIIINQFIIKLG